jgi:hypothetical protein
MRKEDYEFEARMGYIMKCCLKKKKKFFIEVKRDCPKNSRCILFVLNYFKFR